MFKRRNQILDFKNKSPKGVDEKKYNLICITHLPPEKRISISFKTATKFSRYAKVIYFSELEESVVFRKLFISTNVLKILKSLYFAWRRDFSNWFFFEIIPFNRFEFIRNINYYINVYLLKLLLKKKKLVVVSSYPSNQTANFIKKIKPDLAFGDCMDLWGKRESLYFREYFKGVFTNSKPLYEHQNRYGRTYFVPAGYLSKKTIVALGKKRFAQKGSKTVLYIGLISWRINCDLFFSLVNKLQNYKFVFVGSELFDYNLENKGRKRQRSNEFAKKSWLVIKNLPNVEFIEMADFACLPDLNIRAGVGIIPTDPYEIANKYCHPIKTYYYQAMGLPVVSTQIPSIKQYGSKYFQFANTPKELAEHIRKLTRLHIPEGERKKMTASALHHSYESKVKSINEVIIEELKDLK